jgi:hypothetical protein
VDLGAVVDAALVGAPEPAGLDPGVWEMALTVQAEEQHAAHGGHLPPLLGRDEAEGFEVGTAEPAHARERLGSGSEVQSFRVEPWHRLFVEGLAPCEPAEFLDQLPVGPPVGGADPHVDAAVEPLALQVVRAARARVDTAPRSC